MGRRGIAAVVVALVAACGSKESGAPDVGRSAPQPIDAAVALTPPPDAAVPVVVEPRRLWTAGLEDEDDFLAYSKEIGGERFTKFVVDLESDAVYYFDVDVYRVHKDFVFAELFETERTKQAVKAFDRNYTANKPQFLLCYLVHHLGADVWTFAFWEGDKATAKHVEHAYRRMKETFYLGDQVKFRPDSDRQEKVARKLKGVPVLTNDALYKSAEYVVFNPGTSVGTLRLIPPGAAYDELTFASDEIVILPESLPDITPVAGIISETFSTPLAHVSLRARAWGIPNVGLKGAAATYRGLAGKVVFFEATASAHTLREATADEIAGWNVLQLRGKEVVVPVADLTQTELRGLDTLRATDVTAYGAKASNLGEIVHARLRGFTVPDGFGVPIHYYDAHLRAAGLDARVAELLADPTFRKDPARRKKALEELRAAIVAAPLDPEVQAKIVARTAELTGGDPEVGVFVRSSTNAEDLPGFNGAGLYDTFPNVRGEEAIADALKKVWASVWNLRAYEEREHYQIDHTQVHGAVLIQIGIDATAAGVLVTAHPTDPQEKTTYTINAKSGLGIRVVEGKKVPEILLYDFHNHGLRILSRSDEDTMLVFDEQGGTREVPNPRKGKPVLTDARARALGGAARQLVEVFPRDRPLDIEWLFRGEEVFIVQARPYVVR